MKPVYSETQKKEIPGLWVLLKETRGEEQREVAIAMFLNLVLNFLFLFIFRQTV